ncbi:OprO/OprP family phosphate-selective porin [Stenotrophomonas tumulicola]|uniref:Porin n=1 Tax=Stenotrophomonas tumulicola TaxID=1685415 RepID=A0A7W3FLC2_9GAMM|nr:porin [Stenotrophomonas tumulicola]MBA8681654.1 porin [Stenotrophomonas tumulicola]
MATCVLLAAAVPARAAEDDRPVTAAIGGRLHLDFATFDNDNRGTPNKDDTEIRRAWLDVSGRFFVVDYKMEADFSGDRVEAKDVFVSRGFGDAGRLTVGQFKQYFSLDDRTGSNYGSFLERGNAGTTLAPLYRLGASWQANPGDFTWAASIYSLESIDAWKVKGRAAGGRATWAPSPASGDVLHLGISLARELYDNPGGSGTPALQVRPRAAGHLSDESRLTLVDFSNGRDTDVNKWSLEYAQVRGPLSWQGEFSGATFDDGLQRGKVLAGYGMLSWFVTGESRAYDRKTGRFARVKDIQHKAGAFELALRYDQMRGDQHLDGLPDLRDGSTEAWTLGGNWYLRDNLRFMLNLIESRNRDRLADVTVDRTRALTGRLQFDF